MMTAVAVGLVLGTISYALIDYFGGRALSGSGIAPLPMPESSKLYGAWDALMRRLDNQFPPECLQCVLEPLGVDVTTFMAYISNGPKFFDGSISTIYVSDASNESPPKDMPLFDFFKDKTNEYVSRRPAPDGLMAYTTPENVD